MALIKSKQIESLHADKVIETNDRKFVTEEQILRWDTGAGSSGYASIPLIGEKVTQSDGACTITVTYEDNKGNATTVTEPTNIYVMDMAAMASEITDEEMVEPEKKTVIWPYIVGGIVVIIIIVLVIRRNKKKRKQAEEELIDDDI